MLGNMNTYLAKTSCKRTLSDIRPVPQAVSVAAQIVSLRPALEGLVIRAAKEPEQVLQLSPLDMKVIAVIRELCKLDAGRNQLEVVPATSTVPRMMSRRPPRGHSLAMGGPSSYKYCCADGNSWANNRTGFANRGGYHRGSGGSYGGRGAGYGGRGGFRGGYRGRGSTRGWNRAGY